MKRRFRSRFALPPVWFGAAAVFLTGAVLLRAETSAQTRPAHAAAQTQPGMRAAAQTQPEARTAAQTQSEVHASAQTQPDARAAAQTQPQNEAHPAAQTQPTSDAPSVKPAALNVWDLYLKGGYFMYPLTLCSILAVALIIERFLALRRSVVIPRAFLPGLREMGADPREYRAAALAYCRAMDSPIARMLAAGIKRLPRGVLAAEKAIEDAGVNEALKLRRNMRFLYAIGSVATLLGLIGTISGMIKAFQSAAASSGNGDVDKVTALSTGIYEAMVNTFAGLAVAIVVTTFYYFFVGRIERLISELNDTLAQFSDEFDFDKAELEVEQIMRIRDPITEGEEPYNLVPLTDMVFNLLIFFMCATTFVQVEKEMTLRLPKAGSAGPITETVAAEPLIVNIEKSGHWIISGKGYDDSAELARRIRQAVAKNKDQVVVIRADEDGKVKSFADVIRICTQAGVKDAKLVYINSSGGNASGK